MTSITRLLETALYVADLDRSCDFYERVLGLGPDVGIRQTKTARSDFDLCKCLAGKCCFFFQRASPRPRRFFPEVRSRHTTAMGGFIWRSPSPLARSPNGENAYKRTVCQ